MKYLNVRVISQEESPVIGKKVSVFVSHSFLPKTWLETFTDDDGKATFNFDGVSADVYINGKLKLARVRSNSDITVYV